MVSVLRADDKDGIRDLVELANRGFHNSAHTLTGGRPAAEFFDVDQVGLGYCRGADGDIEYDFEYGQAFVSRLIGYMAVEIRTIAESTPFDRLAFIDKGPVGPAGTLTWREELSEETGYPALLVLPWKRLHVASVKGAPVRDGERFLVVSDVATEGDTIASAAKKLWRLGGRVPAAIVLLDREQGAAENLQQLGIALHGVASVSDMARVDDVGLNVHLKPLPKRYIDLGGAAGL